MGTAADRLCRKSVLCNQQLAERRVTSLTNPWTTIELFKGSSEDVQERLVVMVGEQFFHKRMFQ